MYYIRYTITIYNIFETEFQFNKSIDYFYATVLLYLVSINTHKKRLYVRYGCELFDTQ